MKYTFALAAVSALVLALPAHAEDKPVAGDYVMLKVNGEDIKKSEVDDAWKSIFQGQGRAAPGLDSFGEPTKDKFLREVASEHVLYQEATKEGVENSPEVKETLEKVKRQIIIQQLLSNKTKDAVSDDKLKAAYDAHLKASEGTNGGEEIHARHILVKTKEEADAIEKKLKAGDSFEKLAKDKSQDKGSGAEGGDLGWFTADKMVPEFSSALLKLKKGEISQPVKTDFGWHIIQLEDKRKATPPAFDAVKDSLKQEIGGKAVGDYVKTVMANVTITQVDAQGHEKALPPESAKDTPAAKDKDAGAE